LTQMRVRFAPSPTGHLHIGSARTALFNWLWARRVQGTYVLRIEDTDRDRSTIGFERTIVEDLAWLGLAWDEGPETGGAHGPYRQTERMAAGIYLKAAERLLADGLAYECFCTPEELAVERETALAKKQAPRYSGKCRRLPPERRQAFLEQGRQAALRFAVQGDRSIAWDDLIKGPLEFASDVIGDFIIVRQNQAPTYNFAAVVDDLEMRITHVLRGEDHITNTARQILLIEALGGRSPAFGHLSMILGPDRAKLSKRHGAAAVGDYRREGYLAAAVVNYLSLLSWSPPGGEEVFDLEEVTAAFSLERVSKSPAIFDAGKLKWLNGRHIRRLTPTALTHLILPYLNEAFGVAPTTETEFADLIKIAEAIQTNIELLTEAPAYAKIFFVVDYGPEALSRLAGEEAKRVLRAFAGALPPAGGLEKDEAKRLIAQVAAQLKAEGIKGKDIFGVPRLALTGETSGPELFYLLYALGVEEAAKRIGRFI
jgi:nondiscriminating glutamyl-tRNA synthetase